MYLSVYLCPSTCTYTCVKKTPTSLREKERQREREREEESRHESKVVERKKVLSLQVPRPTFAKFTRNFRETFRKSCATILDFRHRPRIMAALVWKLGYVTIFARKIFFAAPSRNFREALSPHLAVLLYELPYTDLSVNTHTYM